MEANDSQFNEILLRFDALTTAFKDSNSEFVDEIKEVIEAEHQNTNNALADILNFGESARMIRSMRWATLLIGLLTLMAVEVISAHFVFKNVISGDQFILIQAVCGSIGTVAIVIAIFFDKRVKAMHFHKRSGDAKHENNKASN